MEFKKFDSVDELREPSVAALKSFFEADMDMPYGVMLTGGDTVGEIYDRLAKIGFNVNPNLHLLLSDERHVPVSSSDSNYGFIQNLVQALNINESQVIRPDTDLPIQECADKYHHDLANFLTKGTVPYAILGLGADGHLASIFSLEDMKAGEGRLAHPTYRPEGPDRISVSQKLLLMIKKIQFVSAGTSKFEIIEQLKSAPETVVAGTVLKDAEDVSLWYCE
ncbi:hypothetical protein BVX94_03190 [bacterium B17]|nr:hypothetical protein BVX94_03190 [bacterium B17]